MTIRKLLVANRGEIACRIFRTCRRLGVATVAVYSDEDAHAQHVEAADEAVRIGEAPPAKSYLRIDAVIEAAKRTGADAIHPGYGFLSERAAFARACADAGITFVGPPADAIDAMGSKSAAKALMDAAGVPITPGYHGDDQTPEIFLETAARIGYPVMLKAAAGGGGKGMRLVERPDDLLDRLESAKREALKSFGDDRMLIEKAIVRPRHIEVQVIADTHGNALWLYERECSVQRRHQKVLEEAPSPLLTPEQRKKIGEAAVAAAKAVGYVNAGTVEFISDQEGNFYFMEMNTRLQVEHPVTEEILGIDLVEWQLAVAAGRPLPKRQDEIVHDGWAMEVRLYAEDADNGFLPAVGTLKRLVFPAESRHVRVDTGVRPGDTISIHYDPMIAKIITWDRDRPRAVARMIRALGDTEVVGCTTNLRFLSALAAHPAFASGRLDTGFIAAHHADLFHIAHAPHTALTAAVVAHLADRRDALRRAAAGTGDPHSPWATAGSFVIAGLRAESLLFHDRGREVAVRVEHTGPVSWRVEADGVSTHVRLAGRDGEHHTIDTGDALVKARVSRTGHEYLVNIGGRQHRFVHIDPGAVTAVHGDAGDGRLSAPMPGQVVKVLVKSGDAVTRGQPLVVLEAMKMEHTIAAPADGTVENVMFNVGDQVRESDTLVAFSARG